MKPVPVFYAVLCVGRILSLSRTSFYDSVCCFVFFFAVVTEAISFLLITLQFSEIHIARDSKRKMECVAAYSSLYPRMIYYLNRLNDWGCISGNAKSVGKYFLPKANDMSCAVISVVKSNLSRTSVSLMREPGKTIMICSTKMSARTGETKSIRQRKLLIFLLSVWKKCWLLLNPSKKKLCNGNRL